MVDLGGIALGINTHSIKPISLWGGPWFLGMDIFSSELGRNLRIVNVYAPNHNRMELWNHLLQLSLINYNNIILGGDLNFMIDHEES